MPAFVITAKHPLVQGETQFIYNTDDSSLTNMFGKPVVSPDNTVNFANKQSVVFDKDRPATKITPRVLKISLGLSCNYECEYCNQRFVPRAAETNPGDIAAFLTNLDTWVTTPPERIEFWGGEPLVYIKTMRPLAEAIKKKYPDARLSFITNGSLLNSEINTWIDEMGFFVGISHDGPGQAARGPDPLDVPEQREAILDLYRRLSPQHRVSFNVMLHKRNQDRAAAVDFFVALTGDPKVPLGEGGLIDAYDADAVENSLPNEDFAQFRAKAYAAIRSGKSNNFSQLSGKLATFLDSFRKGRPASVLGQKCGMDKADNISVDLKGNILTCQNTSAASLAPNGESHKIGHVSDLSNAKLNTARHWATRSECPKCPMLHICGGSCMYLEDSLWETTCDNAFSDAVPVFAAVFEALTGCVPLRIDGPHRADRKDIWNPPVRKVGKKVIPITVVS